MGDHSSLDHGCQMHEAHEAGLGACVHAVHNPNQFSATCGALPDWPCMLALGLVWIRPTGQPHSPEPVHMASLMQYMPRLAV